MKTADPTLVRLRAARRAAGYRQAQACDAAGMTRQAYSAIETGRRKFMAGDLVTLCRLFRVTPDWMLGFCERSVEDERRAFR